MSLTLPFQYAYLPDQCRLLLQIISARNVPVRASDDQRGTATSPVAAARQQQQQELQQRQTQQPLPGGGGDDNTLANDEDFEVRIHAKPSIRYLVKKRQLCVAGLRSRPRLTNDRSALLRSLVKMATWSRRICYTSGSCSSLERVHDPRLRSPIQVLYFKLAGKQTDHTPGKLPKRTMFSGFHESQEARIALKSHP